MNATMLDLHWIWNFRGIQE